MPPSYDTQKFFFAPSLSRNSTLPPKKPAPCTAARRSGCAAPAGLTALVEAGNSGLSFKAAGLRTNIEQSCKLGKRLLVFLEAGDRTPVFLCNLNGKASPRAVECGRRETSARDRTRQRSAEPRRPVVVEALTPRSAQVASRPLGCAPALRVTTPPRRGAGVRPDRIMLQRAPARVVSQFEFRLSTLSARSWSVPVTEGRRQERPLLKEASNASARPGAQHSTQAIERRESTLSGHCGPLGGCRWRLMLAICGRALFDRFMHQRAESLSSGRQFVDKCFRFPQDRAFRTLGEIPAHALRFPKGCEDHPADRRADQAGLHNNDRPSVLWV